jgi:hypothetical protein
LLERFKYAVSNMHPMKAQKALIPANVDPIKLADEIKGDMAKEWLKRKKAISAPPLAR